MMDNLFFVEKNLIKVSCVPWKNFLLFFGSSVFLKSNFSKNFLEKFSPDYDAILLEHCSNFSYSLPKILREFSHFCRMSTFPLISHLVSTFSQSVNKVLQNFS